MKRIRTAARVELSRSLQIIDLAFDKRSWHGSNLAGSFRGLRARDAAWRLPGRKSIWEQVLHAAYWKQRALNILSTTTRFPRSPGNWPRLPRQITEHAWRADIALLYQIHAKLRTTIASLPPQKLNAKARWLIQGVAFHDIYHAGQIRLLRRLRSRLS